ncbi:MULTISPECIES: response regulator [Actinoalloteichus]|uniref:Two-component system response regulator n=1 Tax=Actinoalloteichus fjordicus TaxID=1612552 RepID=A0AAC9PTR1_9PSEU|nr:MULTISPECIES: response regulator transcription factor [Actinoalloteichus]APU16312.1 putative two-component system response regulator [Actinoalloteichus fjordicus]APU22371.1 putative two-component system response regulator [Actinoalloteichus sp. GBA129-24]
MRIVIAEDLLLLREGLAQILAAEGHQVVAAVEDAPALMSAVGTLAPDLSIIDVRLPPGFRDEGLRAAVALRRRLPDTRVLILSQYVERAYAAELLSDGRGGVGYLLKDRVADLDEFIATVERVAAGGTAMDPEVVAQLLNRNRRDPTVHSLTPREHDVLAEMAEGRSNTALAARLHLSLASVEKHIRSILTKLDLPPDQDTHRRVRAVLAYLDHRRR